MRSTIIGGVAGLVIGILAMTLRTAIPGPPAVQAQVPQVAAWLIHAPTFNILGEQVSTENTPCDNVTVTGSWVICNLPAPDREGGWTYRVYSSTRVFSVKGRESPRLLGQ